MMIILVELIIIDKEIFLEFILRRDIKQNLKSDSEEINNYHRKYEKTYKI